MAGESRTASRSVELSRALQDRPFKFDFFEALRRLECAYRDKPRLGQSARVADAPIRLSQEPSLGFAPSTLAAFTSGKDGRPSRLAVLFFGLFGPNGPLPLHLTEYARDRQRNSDDPTFRRFADLFHHRLLALFYRAWANGQPTVNFDRPESDRFAVYVGSLFGLAMPSLRERDALSDLSKLHYAGRLSCRTRHAEGLRAMVEDYFGMPVEIRQFVGQWVEIPEDARWRLGVTPETGTLGRTTTVGSRVWECQQKFRIAFGPLGAGQYERLLPGSESLRRLVALVRAYVGDELTWDVNLILKKQDVPPLVLGGKGRVGWMTWLVGGKLGQDVDDLLLDPLGDPNANVRVFLSTEEQEGPAGCPAGRAG